MKSLLKKFDDMVAEETVATIKAEPKNPTAKRLRFWSSLLTVLSLGLFLPFGLILDGIAELIEQNERLIERS